MTDTLAKKFDGAADLGLFDSPIPDFITANLGAKISLRHYQETAIKRFIYYIEGYPKKITPSHLLFHMATGSGKTVIMAALIIYLYQRGYRNFLFFVNSSQIVEKTKVNFLSQASSKYLFADMVRIDDKPVAIRQVSNFEESVPTDINILFTTVQGLHMRLADPRENGVTIEDFERQKIVFISDEAHHLNAETKAAAKVKLGVEEEEERKSWEGTVSAIFQKNPDNILLEFTATTDFEHPAIFEKYKDKVLYDYSLKQFREDGYSKDIELRQADLSVPERMMQAVILSQYRRKLAEANGIHLKPVILMKSAKIAESAENETAFNTLIKQLTGASLIALQTASAGDESLTTAFDYFFTERGITPDNLAIELQSEFAPEKVINVNKPQDLEAQQILLNSLEDYANEVRVIFAVDKLNEGWDVLNLYDIVRLYDKRDSGGKAVGKTTMAEAQLIGRGARYYPFTAPEKAEEPREKRKYDQELGHPLRALEELYYHCSHNPKYIDDIKRALKETGMMADDEKRVVLKVKDSFKASAFFQKQWIFLNELKKNARDGVEKIEDYLSTALTYPSLLTGAVVESSVFGSGESKAVKGEPVSKTLHLKDFGQPILRFAVDANEFFHFRNLKVHFPKLASVREFITSENYLGAVTVAVRGLKEDLDALTPRQQLEITHFVLHQIEAKVRTKSVDYNGTKDFKPKMIKDVVVDKEIKIRVQGEQGLSWKDSKIKGLDQIDLYAKDWHVYDDSYGTDQEKLFLRYIHDHSEALKKVYEEFFVIRNEKLFQLYRFADGRAFEPDFVMFLKRSVDGKEAVMQVFIEPKGKQLVKEDAWKQDFLKTIETDARIEVIVQNKDFRVLGLPFFNEENPERAAFDLEFTKLET